MISNYGIEDCCGALFQWARDCSEAMSISWASGTHELQGYSWHPDSVYDSLVDTQSYGQFGGLLRRVRLGGEWGSTSRCGSRSGYYESFSARGGYDAIGARGTSETR